jgi:hypothetical protein
LLSQDEKELVQDFQDQMIRIDPYPVKTTQFALTDTEKDLLVWKGRAAARVFLQKAGLATLDEVSDAKKKADQFYAAVIDARNSARRRRKIILVGIVIVAAIFIVVEYGRQIEQFAMSLFSR